MAVRVSSRLKKIIIVFVVFIALAGGALAGITLFSNMTDIIVNDLRITKAEDTSIELFKEEVYLTANENNYFDIKVLAYASDPITYTLTSSDTSIAKISAVKNAYRVNYFRPGTVTISANIAGVNIKDSFELVVKENVPTAFAITDNKAINEKEISIFADDKEYAFEFTALQGVQSDDMNISSLVLIEDYNRDIFEDIYIDDVNSKLIIKAKESTKDAKEYITIQSKYIDSEGNSITVGTFTICVNVKGYYISGMQLIISENSTFDNSSNIYGGGVLREGEKRIESVYLTNKINTVYAKVRIIYTNNDIFHVSQEDISTTVGASSNAEVHSSTFGDYYEIVVNKNNTQIQFTYEDIIVNFHFFYTQEGTSNYASFIKSLYTETNTLEGKRYAYNYWDNRFKRDDVVTDKNGNIIGFLNEIVVSE